MLLLGRQMAQRGIEYEYWFCTGSNRLAEFMETGRATLAPVARLAGRLEHGDFDVVHMTATDPTAEVVAMLASRSKVVVSARGGLADIWHHENCFAYTAISEGMALVNQPLTDIRIEVVRNSIDIDRFTPALEPTNGVPIVAFVGRTTDDIKDFPRFTRIVRRLAEREGGVRVWIADPHEANWDKFTNRSVERIDTERWGRVPHDEIPDFYRDVAKSGGVVVMTSRSEGFGNVGPEAAACGVRVAAPDVMGLREAIIHEVTGRIFPADASDDDVAAMLDQWLACPHDRERTSIAARAAFAPSAMLDAYLRIYERGEQQLVSAPSLAPDYAERALLHEHLARQRKWRAQAARDAAVGLAGEGRPRLALGALAIAYRAAPRQFLNMAAMRQVVSTVYRIMRRGTRRMPPVATPVGVA